MGAEASPEPAVGEGAEGVARVRSGAYDLIFTDIQTPVMGGVHATREIRALSRPVAHTPSSRPRPMCSRIS